MLKFPPEYWKNRADEARAVAEQFKDEQKQIMLEISAGYDKMVEAAERLERSRVLLSRQLKG